ncbi:putative TNFR/NGFR cysteine-rich region, na-Ca exchanger/integrin-beta4 [Plasmopara halstedii]
MIMTMWRWLFVLKVLFSARGYMYYTKLVQAADANGRFQFSHDIYSSTKAFGVVSISIQRGLGSDGRAAVYVSTIPGLGNAVADQDFKSPCNVSLVWQDGDDFDKDLYVPIYNDGKPQIDPKSFVLALHDAVGAHINADRNQAQVVLLPSSKLIPASFTFQDTAIDVVEGEELIIPVLWTSTTMLTASVNFEIICNTACFPMDFVLVSPVSQLLEWKCDNNFANDATQLQNISLRVNNDNLYEQAESFIVRLVGVEPQEEDAIRIERSKIIPEILVRIKGPNDVRQGSLQFVADCYPDCASTKYLTLAGGAALVTIQRLNGSDGDCSVVVATKDDTAKAGLDYDHLKQKLNWKDGDFSDRQVVVSMLFARADPDESPRRLMLVLQENEGASLSDVHASISFIEITGPTNEYHSEINFAASEFEYSGLLNSNLSFSNLVARGKMRHQFCPNVMLEEPGVLSVVLQRNFAALFVPAQVTVKSIANTASSGVDYESLTEVVTWVNEDSKVKKVLLRILIPPSYDPHPRSFWLQLSDVTGAKFGECNVLQVILKGIAQGPHLVSFDLNMAIGTLTLHTNIPARASTLKVTKLLLQSNLKVDITFQFNARQSTTRSADGTSIVVNIGPEDLNSLKRMVNFVENANAILLSTKAGLFQHVLDDCQSSGNFVCSSLLTLEVPTSAALTVSMFTPDSLPPVLVGYSLDLPQQLLMLHFSEAVDRRTVQIEALTLAETAAGIETYRLLPSTTHVVMPELDSVNVAGQRTADDTILTLQIGQTDVTALRSFGAGRIGITRARTFLGIKSTFVADFAGNAVKAVGVASNMLQHSAADCSRCPDGSFLTKSCSDLKDRICAPCSVCPQNSYAIEVCSALQDTVCYPCTECRSNHYVSIACTPMTDRVCAPCTQCTLDEFEVSLCAAGVDRVCRTCNSCKLNAAQRTLCQHSPMWKRLQMRSPFSCPRPVQEFQSREKQLQRAKSNRCGSGRCSCTNTGIAGNLNPFGNGFPDDQRCTGPERYNILV